MSLALADVQTALLELLHVEGYVIQEMSEARVVETAARAVYRTLLVNQTRSIRAAMLREQFRAALTAWHKETEVSSLLDEKRKHPSYRQIIGMERKPFR